jgi:Rrf2 family protein
MLSTSSIYAIRAAVYLASQPREESKTGIKKISSDLKLPAPFLAKILQQLAKQKILSSSKGPHGGFSFLRDPRKLTILDIVSSIDGAYTLTRCIMHNGSCDGENSEKYCALHKDYDKSRADLIELFGNMTIHDLAEKSVNLELINI